MAAIDVPAEISPATEAQPSPTSVDGSISRRNSDNAVRFTRRSRYRLPVISGKGAILTIVWNLFFATSLLTCNIPQQNELMAGLFVVFYPIVGWLGDCKFGKYKVLRAAPYFLLSSIVLHNLSVFVFLGNFLLAWSAAAAGILAALCYASSVLPFLIDQMIGASGEELSFTIYWTAWGILAGW